MLRSFEVLRARLNQQQGYHLVLEEERFFPGINLTFLTFLFHSSFATRTLAVFCARPAETTMPFVSFTNRPATLAVVAMVLATAVLDILGPRYSRP